MGTIIGLKLPRQKKSVDWLVEKRDNWDIVKCILVKGSFQEYQSFAKLADLNKRL